MRITKQWAAAKLAVDTNDPNTTAPDDSRLFQGPSTRQTTPTAAYVLAVGGPITVELWMYSDQMKQWFKVAAATACAQDALTYLPTIPPLDGGALFLRVTVNAGTAAGCGVGFQGAN
jgi:hypothetical protein